MPRGRHPREGADYNSHPASGPQASPAPLPSLRGQALRRGCPCPRGRGELQCPGHPPPRTGAGPRRRGRGLGPREDPVPVWDAMGRPPPRDAPLRPYPSPCSAPPRSYSSGPAPPLPGRELAPPPRASALPPSPPVPSPIGRGTPARPSGGGAEGGERRPGEGARAAAEDGDSGEGGRVGGGLADPPAD